MCYSDKAAKPHWRTVPVSFPASPRLSLSTVSLRARASKSEEKSCINVTSRLLSYENNSLCIASPGGIMKRSRLFGQSWHCICVVTDKTPEDFVLLVSEKLLKWLLLSPAAASRGTMPWALWDFRSIRTVILNSLLIKALGWRPSTKEICKSMMLAGKVSLSVLDILDNKELFKCRIEFCASITAGGLWLIAS